MVTVQTSKLPALEKATGLEIRYVAVSELTPYVRNSRTHSDAQITQIANSIREFGFTNPVLIDGDNGIIAGHGRLMAASSLGMTEVPVIELPHLTEMQKRAYVIADNKLALNAGWDKDMLIMELGDLHADGFDLNLTGFKKIELDLMLDGADFTSADDAEGEDSGGKKACTCPECGHVFTPEKPGRHG